MSELNWKLGLSIASLGFILIVFSIPLALGKIGPNPWYGVRFLLSYKSDDHWYAINRYGGRLTCIWGMVILVLGLAGLFLPTNNESLLLGGIIFSTSLVFMPVVQGWRFAKQFDANWEKDRSNRGNSE